MHIPKKPADKCDESKEPEKVPNEEVRSYYYDDAHGYEDYDPEKPDEDEPE